MHLRPNLQMVLFGSSSIARPVGCVSVHCEFLQALPYLHWIPLVPSQGNCFPVVFAGTASLLGAAGLGDVAALGGATTGSRPGCGMSSMPGGGTPGGPGRPQPPGGGGGGLRRPGMGGGGFTIAGAPKGGGGGGGNPGIMPGSPGSPGPPASPGPVPFGRAIPVLAYSGGNTMPLHERWPGLSRAHGCSNNQSADT